MSSQILGNSMHEVTFPGMSSKLNTLEDSGFGNRNKKLLEGNHLHWAPFALEVVSPDGKQCHLASNTWRG